jgi:hypothetical protein
MAFDGIKRETVKVLVFGRAAPGVARQYRKPSSLEGTSTAPY